jgi:hypothetical protein
MEFNYRYHGSTAVASSAQATEMSFAPDTLREPTYFVGTLGKHLPFREAISALHHVVVSDLRFKPKDRSEYLAWVQRHETEMLGEFMAQQGDVEARIRVLRQELDALRKDSTNLLQPFHKARQRYFNYLYKRDYNWWFVLDPVISVHPDEVFFECFSQDESSYGRLGCSYEVFKEIQEFACGTTNIDYSAALYDEFQKIRDYKSTALSVDPRGFQVETGTDEAYREEQIDLPESWVRGFLQVSSAMTLPARRVDLHPMDVHNFCFMLRRRKERTGPRSMRFYLTPGEPVRVVFEPWNQEVRCPRSIYQGETPDEIRVWGRRRLLILERLIPWAQKFTLYLLGSGLPSVYVVDLGDMSFTLALSGWTANDWSRLGNFDLMAPRAQVDHFTQVRVFKALQENWQESADSLAARLDLERGLVLGALSAYTQAGRVIYDLNKEVYRVRELSREPLPMEQLRFANPREEKAERFIAAGLVKLERQEQVQSLLTLMGTVWDDAHAHQPELVLDRDERLMKGSCTCSFYVRNKLHKGPCEHLLALRMQYAKLHAMY